MSIVKSFRITTLLQLDHQQNMMMSLNSKFVNVANRANLIMGLSRNMTSLSSIFSAECSRMKICAKLHEKSTKHNDNFADGHCTMLKETMITTWRMYLLDILQLKAARDKGMVLGKTWIKTCRMSLSISGLPCQAARCGGGSSGVESWRRS